MVFIYGGGIGERAYFGASESLSQRVRDNKIEGVARKPFPTLNTHK
jgi:hypothetical protein